MKTQKTEIRPWTRKAARVCLLAAQIIFLVWLIRCIGALWFGQTLTATSLAMFAALAAVIALAVMLSNTAVIGVLFTRDTRLITAFLSLISTAVLAGLIWLGFLWASGMEETPSAMAAYGAIVSLALAGVAARSITVMRIAQRDEVTHVPWRQWVSDQVNADRSG